MPNKLTGLLVSAILVTGLAATAFAQGAAPAAAHLEGGYIRLGTD